MSKKKETRGRKPKPPEERLVRVVVYLSQEIAGKVEAQAKKQNEPVSVLLRRVIWNVARSAM